MKLTVVTPYGTKFSNEGVESVTIPTEAGVITVLDEHVPLISILSPGEIVIQKSDGSEEILAVSRGVVEVKAENHVAILADTAESADEIDVDRALEAKKAAEEMLQQKSDIEDIEFANIMSKLEKELARINVGKRWKK
jgi:F-type H+-transporting ATPase subunit epsilon